MTFDLKIFADKLQRCRTQLKLDLLEVQKGTGLNIERIKNLESGKTEPTGDEVLILSDFYKQDYNFFISNEKLSASEQIDILYRKFGDSFSKGDRWVIQEFIYLCECEQFIWDELHESFREFSFQITGSFFKGHGLQAAIELRKKLGYDIRELVKDPYYEFRKLGLHIFRRRLENSNISGLFIKHPFAGKCILVNYDEDIFRQNFTLTHEVAHSIFDYNENINISFSGDWNKGDLIEIRANTFASNFLIPKDALLSLKVAKWNEDNLIRVALQLKTNIIPLLISLKELSLITDNEYRQFSNLKIGINKKIDPELENVTEKIKKAKQNLLEKGLSSYYVRKCFEAYQLNMITKQKLSEMFLSDEFELPSILEDFSLKFQDGE